MPHSHLAAIALCLTACSAGPGVQSSAVPSGSPKPRAAEAQSSQGRLAELHGLIGMGRQDFIRRFRIRPEHVRASHGYQRMKDLEEVHSPGHAELGYAHFYFQGGRLSLIHLPKPAVQLTTTSHVEEFRGNSTSEAAVLRSRAGKDSLLYVYAEQGIAFSKGKRIDFIELFSPTTQQQYEQAIYVEPGPFPP